jgi:hypothetical protein
VVEPKVIFTAEQVGEWSQGSKRSRILAVPWNVHAVVKRFTCLDLDHLPETAHTSRPDKHIFIGVLQTPRDM